MFMLLDNVAIYFQKKKAISFDGFSKSCNPTLFLSLPGGILLDHIIMHFKMTVSPAGDSNFRSDNSSGRKTISGSSGSVNIFAPDHEIFSITPG